MTKYLKFIIPLAVFCFLVLGALSCESDEEYCYETVAEEIKKTTLKLREIYQRYYEQGRCEDDNDCIGIDIKFKCLPDGCLSPFYRNFEAELRKETHEMSQKCKSYREDCWDRGFPVFSGPPCDSVPVGCRENKCVYVFNEGEN